MPKDSAARCPDAEATLEARDRRIAALATDAYWELDAGLRYRSHEGDSPLVGPGDPPPLGLDRPALVERELVPDTALIEHNRLMRAHREMDVLVPVERPGAERRNIRVVASPRFDADGRFTGYLGYERDITGFVALRERIASIALRDELTGLCNRHGFRHRIEAVRERVVEDGTEHMLCLLDLDRFKLVNDTAGHAAGDRLLEELAALMREAVEPQETLARLGGDEFALLLDGGVERCTARMERLVRAVADHELVWDGRRHGVGASIGMASMAAGPVQHVIDLADGACYASKEAGRDRCTVFTVDSLAYRRHRRELEQVETIKTALRERRFRLALSTIAPARTDAPAPPWREASVRLDAGDAAGTAPELFLPVAERFGLMAELDLWTLERALDAADDASGRGRPAERLSVDLSANALGDDALLGRILRLLRARSPMPGSLCIELAESTVAANVDAVAAFMRELRTLGVRIALDRFGTGLSALAHLAHLPVDALKIDPRLWRQVRGGPGERAVVRAVVDLARELGIETVATGVDDGTAREHLAAAGIDFVQGEAVDARGRGRGPTPRRSAVG